jgi:hypothetical protein
MQTEPDSVPEPVVPEQRITERIEAVSMTELLHIGVVPVAPPPDPDTFDPPTNPRYRVRAYGTDQAIKTLDLDAATARSFAGALEALMPEGLGAMAPSRSRATTERMVACDKPVWMIEDATPDPFEDLPTAALARRSAMPRALVIAIACLLALAAGLLILL